MWIAAGRVVFLSAGFISTIALARLLTPDDFGLVAIVTTINYLLQSLTSMPLASALIQHEEPTKAHFDTAFTLSIIRSSLLAVVLASCSLPIALFYEDPRLTELFLAISVSSAVTGFANPKLIVMDRDLVFWQKFVLQSVDKLLTVIVAVTVALVWKSYWALLVGVFTGQIVSLIIGYFIVPFLPGLTISKWRELISFTGWLSLKSIVDNLNWRSDQLFIGYFLGNASLGAYNLGQRLATMPTQEALAPISGTLFPAFSKIRNDLDRLRRNYLKAQNLMAAIALPLGVGFALVAGDLVPLALGDKWQDAVLVIQFVASLAAFQVIGHVLDPLALSLGQTRLLFTRGLIEFAVRMPLTITGLILAGIPGLLCARLISGSISILIRLFMVRRLIGVSVIKQFLDNWPTFLALGSMIMTCVTLQRICRFLIPDLSFLSISIVVIGGAIAYLSTRLLIWKLANMPEGPDQLVVQQLRKLWTFLSLRIDSK